MSISKELAHEHLAELLQAWAYATEVLFAAGRFQGVAPENREGWDNALASLVVTAHRHAEDQQRWPDLERAPARDAVWDGSLITEIFRREFVDEARRRWIAPVPGILDPEDGTEPSRTG